MDFGGAPARGEVDAESKQAVADQLKARGLIVLDIADKAGSKDLTIPMLRRVRPRDLTVMTRQFSTMVSSGMTILRALYVLEVQTQSKLLKETLDAVRKDVEAGLALSDALARHPKVFNPLYVAMVRAGESGGLLESALLRIADQLEKDDSLRRQVKAAMVYPGVIITFAGLILVALVAFIVPVFAKIFHDFHGKLPSITQFTVALSDALTGYWFLFIAGAIALVIGFQKWRKSEWGRPQWDLIRIKIPFRIGETVQKVALARWSRTLSALF